MKRMKKRVICPECKGKKVMLYPNKWDELEQALCYTCNGKGIMYRIVDITYKPVEDAK